MMLLFALTAGVRGYNIRNNDNFGGFENIRCNAPVVSVSGCVFRNAALQNCKNLEGAVSIECIDAKFRLRSSKFCRAVSVSKDLFQVIAPVGSEIRQCEFKKLGISAVKYASSCVTANSPVSGLKGDICLSDCRFDRCQTRAIDGTDCTKLTILRCTFTGIVFSTSPYIIGVKFSSATAAVDITDSTFTDQKARDSGSGMVFDGGSHLVKTFKVNNCNFNEVTSCGHAGVWKFHYMVQDGALVEIKKTTFKTILANGDGIVIYSGNKVFTLVMEDCVVDGAKTSSGNGGGVIYLAKQNGVYSSVSVKNTEFKAVTAAKGCILHSLGYSPITTCTFEGCTIQECNGGSSNEHGLVYAKIDNFIIKQTKFLKINYNMMAQMWLRSMSSSATVTFTGCTFDDYKSKAIIWPDTRISKIEFNGCTIKGYKSSASSSNGDCMVSSVLASTVNIVECSLESADSHHALVWAPNSVSSASITVSRTTFNACKVTADPMLYLVKGTYYLDQCTFVSCQASDWCMVKASSTDGGTITNFHFKSMSPGDKPLLVCPSGIGELVGFQFEGITTSHERGVCCLEIPTVTSLALTDCKFVSSSSDKQAGAIKLESFCSGSSVSFTRCTFDGVSCVSGGGVIMSSASKSYSASFSGTVFKNLQNCAFLVSSVSTLSFGSCEFNTCLRSGSESLVKTSVSSSVSFTSTNFLTCGNENCHMLIVGNTNGVTFTTCRFETVFSKSIVYSSDTGKIGHLSISSNSLFKDFVSKENLAKSTFVKSLKISDSKFEGGSAKSALFLFRDQSQRGTYSYDIEMIRTEFTGITGMTEPLIYEYQAPLKISLNGCKFSDIGAAIIKDYQGKSTFDLVSCEFSNCSGGEATVNLQSAAGVSLRACIFQNTGGSSSTLDISCSSCSLEGCAFTSTAVQSVLKMRNGASLLSCEFYGIQGKACDITGTNSLTHCLFRNIQSPSNSAVLLINGEGDLTSCTFREIEGSLCTISGTCTMLYCVLETVISTGPVITANVMSLTSCTFSAIEGSICSVTGDSFLTNCTFTGVSVGATSSVFGFSGSAELSECTLSEINGSVGVISGTASLTNCSVTNVVVPQGQALVTFNNRATLRSCTFSEVRISP